MRTREFIDGHWYQIERNEDGDITVQSGDDPPLPPPLEDTEIRGLRTLLEKPALNDRDRDRMLKHLLKNSLRGR